MSNISNLNNINISKERIAAEGSGKIFAELLEAQQKDIATAIADQQKKASEMLDQQFSKLLQSKPKATSSIQNIFKRYMEEGNFEKAMDLADNFDGLEV